MRLFLLDVLIWPMILPGIILIVICLGIVGMAVLFAVRIIRNQSREKAESEPQDSVAPSDESKH